jgi:hypothetical protein
MIGQPKHIQSTKLDLLIPFNPTLMKIRTLTVATLTIAVVTFLIASCQSKTSNTKHALLGDPPPTFIKIDSANKMIKSYLISVGAGAADTNLYSIVFNADSLRRMLNDESGGQIAQVKIMFAHTLGYINSGHQNQYCGYKIGALTLVIAGFDTNGNYIYYPAGRVMDLGNPCPPLCPESGTASKDTLSQ